MTIGMTYLTHYNGARPFKCVVSGDLDLVLVFKGDGDGDLLHTFEGRVWIGKDPNEPDHDGNSILVVHTNGLVTYIEESVYTFRPHCALVTYVSEIGNSDVPYPYAIDRDDNYYFFAEDTVVRGAHITNKVDPYSRQGGLYGLTDMTGFEDIVSYSVPGDDVSYSLVWKPNVGHEFRMYDANERYIGDAEFLVVEKRGLSEHVNREQLQQLYDRYAARYGMHAIHGVAR
jgi:hypothetical protein